MAQSQVEFLKPWELVDPDRGDAFWLELKRELSPGHPLYEMPLTPLGYSRAADDVLFEAEDGCIIQVHLTYSGKAEKPPWPSHHMFLHIAEWIEQVMRPEHDEG